MRKLQTLCCYVLLSVLCCSPVFGQSQLQQVKKGIVKIKVTTDLVETIGITPKIHKGIVKTGIPALDKVNQQVKASSMGRVFPYSPKFEEKARRHGLHQWYEIRFENPVTPENAMQMYAKVPGVIAAEVIRNPFTKQPKVVQSNLSGKVFTRAGAPFNDPFLSAQWHYYNDGQSTQGAVQGSDINLYEAWKITTGSPDIVVAIIDGGIDYKHRDLSDNMWVNKAELNGTAGVDDDGNGYVDDIYGYNFVSNSGQLTPEDHGTHVAGTVAAVNNNGIGVGGVAGGSGKGDGVRLMSCQVFVGDETGDFVKSFYYAANNGAVIAQCSWGWPNPDYKEQSVLDAVDYFAKEAGDYEGSPMKGGICIFAAGNQSTEGHFYPAAHPTALAVGAIGNNFKITTYSNTGEWVDIVAPGGVLETISETGVYSTLPNDGYGYMQGTSQACPHVAGIAALVLSKYGNKDYTPEMLRNRLMTAIHDIYPYNPDKVGKSGDGYIDAALALKEDQGKAPEQVTDLGLYADQMTVTVEWTIPNDEDDGFVQKHIVYYSEQEFTADANLSELKSHIIDTKFNTPGEKLMKELGGFKAETEYWMAIQAIDRWGHASVLSGIQKTKTNKGPEVQLDKTQLALTVEATNEEPVKELLQISNIGEGMLKWSGILRTQKKHTVSPKSVLSVRQPQLASVKKQPVKMSVLPYTANERIPAEYSAEAYPQAISYYFFNDDYPAKFIGENDTTQSNSLAQWFIVDEETHPDGFNLTGITMIGKQQTGRPVIEVYSGESKITPEYLLYSDTLNENPTFSDVWSFSKQFYFAPGESFWIVVHIPANNKNPLGAGYVQQEIYSSYSYYSSDMGKNWILLKDALTGGTFTEIADMLCWNVAAISSNPNWGRFITLSPASGNVRPGEHDMAEITSNGQGLVNGTYDLLFDLTSNDPNNADIEIPLKIAVSGHKPNLKSAKVADFGKLFVGESKTVEIEVMNLGYGAFSGKYGGPKYSSSDPNFKVENIRSGFPPRAISSVKVTFNPKQSGTFGSVITLTDQYNAVHRINVTGTAIQPAVIAVNPAEVNGGDLAYKTSKTVTFDITNSGQYPLEFVMPKFSDDEVTGLTATSHRFGYSYSSSIYEYNYSDDIMDDMLGAAFELVNPTDIKDQYGQSTRWSKGIDLGFKFPFYGQTYDSIYISNRGALSVTGYEGALHSAFPPEASDMQGIGLITALGSMELDFDDESHLYYTKQNGKFIISYENAKAINNSDYINFLNGEQYSRVTFRILLSNNGDIEFLYLKFPAMEPTYQIDLLNRPDAIYIGIADVNTEDPFTIYDYNQGKTGDMLPYMLERQYIKISAPQPNMITRVEPASGTVNVGGSETVTLTLTADSTMYEGPLKNILTILSNDPKTSTSYVNVTANITGEYYKPDLVVNRADIDFGEVYQQAERYEIISLSNKGKADVEITGVQTVNNNFTLPFDLYLPLTIKAGCSYDLLVYANTSATGNFEDVLQIESSDKNLEVPLKATIIKAPNISITPSSRKVTMNSGDSQQLDYTIQNTGENTLEYAIKSLPNFYPIETAQADDEITYIAYNSVDKPDLIHFDWIDIRETGTFLDFDYWQEHDFATIDLPFEFSFYGQSYSKVQLCMSGFITFTEYEDRNNLPGPVDKIPSPDHVYRNFIAPYWGNHSPSETKDAGMYYATVGDKFVITWTDYANSANNGVCFQVILYKDGKFKFQYTLLPPFGAFESSYGIAGWENEAGTEGTLLPDRTIAMDHATEVYPVRKHKLAPNASAAVKMMVNTQGLMAGDYPLNAPVKTNVPGKEEMSLNLNLNLLGTPQPVFTPEKIELGDIIMEQLNQDRNFSDSIFKQTIFTVSNAGTAAFKIKRIDYKNFTAGTYNFMLQYSAGKVEGEEMFREYIPGNEGDSGDDDFGGGGNQGGNDGTDDDFGHFSLNPLFGPDMGGNDGTFTLNKNTQRFAIAIYNTETLSQEKDTLVFTTTAGVYKVPVSYNMVASPKAEVPQQDYNLYSPTEEFIHDSTFTLSNTGEYALNYKVTVEYEEARAAKTAKTVAAGSPEKATGTAPVPDNAVSADTPDKLQTRADEDKTADELYPVDEQYRRNLSYPWGKFIGIMGTGEKYNPFIASTKFKAPEDGFNISAIQYVGSIGPLESAVIRAEIRNGSESYLNSKVIAEGEITVTGPEQEDEQHVIRNLRTIEFRNPVYLNPNETFYVFLYFPAGAPTVLAIASTEEKNATDRYYAKLPDEWRDLTSLEAKYGPLGFTVRCLEKTVGEPWISVKGDTKGSLTVGGQKQLTVHVNALQARKAKGNMAHIVIKSNDPIQPAQSFKVTLDKNSGPVITVTDENVSVKENTTGVINFTVADQEGDSFDLELEDANGIASLDKEKSLINLSPKFGHAGNQSCKLIATDVYGYSTEATIEYFVEKVNQAPIVVQPIESMQVKLGEIIETMDLTNVFSDPDGDELTYMVSSDDESVVIGTLKNNSLELVVKGTGEAEITVTAADPSALAASTSFKVTIEESDGAALQKQIEAYPNPVVYTLNVKCPKDLKGEVTLRIYGTDGSLFYSEKTTMAEGVVKTIDMTNYPSGVYILEIGNKYDKLNTKVIKQ